MREIKFRSYDKKEKIMYEPLTLAEILEGNWEAQSADGYNSIPQKDYVFFAIPDTVWMQFTGLQDKNGKDIYEGDIVEAPHDFGPGGFHVRRFPVSFHVELGSYQWNYWLMKEAEVLGNIHENPDLLDSPYSEVSRK